MNNALAVGLYLLAEQGRQEADAVFGGVVWKRCSGQLGAGGDKVSEANDRIAGRTGLNLCRPTDNEGDAMPAIPQVSL